MNRPCLVALSVLAFGVADRQPADAQNCDTACISALETMLRWVSDRYNTPMADIVLDTMFSGWDSKLDRRTPIEPAVIEASARRLGFVHAGSLEVIRCDSLPAPGQQRCRWTRGRVLVQFMKPQIDGDSAHISIEVFHNVKGGDDTGHQMTGYALLLRMRTDKAWRVERFDIWGMS